MKSKFKYTLYITGGVIFFLGLAFWGMLQLQNVSVGYIGLVKVQGTIFEDRVIIKQLHKLNDNPLVKGMVLYINSPGGHITAMYAVYDVIQYVKPDIVTVGMGLCASAASFILAAGTKGKRYALPNTEVMYF